MRRHAPRHHDEKRNHLVFFWCAGNNGLLRSVQSKLEAIQFKLRIPQRKPWSAIADDANSAALTMAQVDKVGHQRSA